MAMVTRNDCNEMGASQWSVGVIGVGGRGAQRIWYKCSCQNSIAHIRISRILIQHPITLLVDSIAVGCLWGCFQETF